MIECDPGTCVEIAQTQKDMIVTSLPFLVAGAIGFKWLGNRLNHGSD